VYDSKTKKYILFDPAIHSHSDPLRFTNTNLGKMGIRQFFRTHVCNSECKRMGLKRHRLQPRNV